MGWLNRIFKGSSHKISEGQYNGKSEDDVVWNEPTSSLDAHALSDNEKEDIAHAIALSIIDAEEKKAKAIDNGSHLEEDEQLARVLQESLNVDSPESPPRENGRIYQPSPFFFSSGFRICAGCNTEIGHGRFLSCMGAVWHPECFRCHDCNRPISDYEFSMYGNHPYHKSCYKERYHPKCDVCKQFLIDCYVGVEMDGQGRPTLPQWYMWRYKAKTDIEWERGVTQPPPPRMSQWTNHPGMSQWTSNEAWESWDNE